MEKLYRIIQEVNNNKSKIVNENNCIAIQFNYFDGLEQILNYQDIKFINNRYKEICKIYKWKIKTLEIDIFDYLDNESEYNDEVLEDEFKNSQFNLIIDKTRLSSEIIEDNQFNIQIYMDEKELIKKLDFESINYKKLEDIICIKLKNIILFIDSEISFYNSSILFIGTRNSNMKSTIHEFILMNNIEYTKQIHLRNTICNWTDSTVRLTPNDLYFNFENASMKSSIVNIIIRSQINLVIMFISNFTGLLDNKLKSIINSNKRIEIEYSNCSSPNIENYKDFYTIYNWIYNGEPFSDKLNICRNVIGALVSAKCQGDTLNTIVTNSDRILKSLNDNLEEFTKGNIKEYFNERSKIDKAILNDINQISDKVEIIIKVFVNGMASLIGFSIAAVIGYIAKGEIVLVKILAILYILQLDIIVLLQTPINIIKLIDLDKEFKIKKEKYINVYFGEDEVSNFENKKKRNEIVLYVYTFIAFVILVMMHIGVCKIVFNNEFINNLLEMLK